MEDLAAAQVVAGIMVSKDMVLLLVRDHLVTNLAEVEAEGPIIIFVGADIVDMGQTEVPIILSTMKLSVQEDHQDHSHIEKLPPHMLAANIQDSLDLGIFLEVPLLPHPLMDILLHMLIPLDLAMDTVVMVIGMGLINLSILTKIRNLGNQKIEIIKIEMEEIEIQIQETVTRNPEITGTEETLKT